LNSKSKDCNFQTESLFKRVASTTEEALLFVFLVPYNASCLGHGVSVDQIISAQPGLIPQMAGFLTSKQIWGCTTFIDHVSNYIYVHLMKDFTIMETLLAKLAFKKLCARADCSVKHYQADNGQFSE
jgi:hypothetical protein